MQVLDLFAGAGGYSEGFKQAGFNVSLAVDNWKLSLESHKANHPTTEHLLQDIRKVKAKHLERYNADVILGSPPCQEFSVANYNPDVEKGLELTHYFLELIENLNPRYWIMENVTGVVKHIKSKVIKAGGMIHVLNSADYGVPQIRKRAFCGRFPFPYPTHAKNPQKTLVGELKRWVNVGEVLQDVELPTDENLEPTEKSLERALAVLNKDDIPYKTAIMEGYKPSHTITAHIGRDFSTGGLIDTSFFDRHGPNFFSFNRPSNTVTSKTINIHVLKDRLRRLSSLEAKIIMGFPKDYIILGKSLVNRFRQIGNAVCPPIAKALGEAILSAV